MFVKETKVKRSGREYSYLQLVEGYRDGDGKVRHRVVANLGRKDALKDFPNIKVLLTKDALYARPAANDLIKAMLGANAQIDGVLAANDAMAFGAIEAFKAADKKVPVVGINASKEADGQESDLQPITGCTCPNCRLHIELRPRNLEGIVQP